MLQHSRVRVLTAALAAGFLVTAGTGAALAAMEAEHQDSSGAEIAAVLAARTAPIDAIRAAEAKAGGRAVEFGLENRADAFGYEVQVVTGTGVAKVLVDPATGAVTVSAEPVARPDAAQGAVGPTTLATAVAAAEQRTGGRALEARATTANAVAIFDVTAVKAPGQLTQVSVNGADGQVIAATKVAGEAADGEMADGKAADGKAADGKAAGSETPDGETGNGESGNGESGNEAN